MYQCVFNLVDIRFVSLMVQLKQATPGTAIEKTDINFEHISEDNRYLIVHKCSGLESQDVDSQGFQIIRDFISHRTNTSLSASERLHAIW